MNYYEIEFWPGHLEYIVEKARTHPQRKFLAVEPEKKCVREALASAPGIAGLKNLRIISGQDCEIIAGRLADREHKARLVTMRVPAQFDHFKNLFPIVSRLLAPKGKIVWTQEAYGEQGTTQLTEHLCNRFARENGLAYRPMGAVNPRTKWESRLEQERGKVWRHLFTKK